MRLLGVSGRIRPPRKRMNPGTADRLRDSLQPHQVKCEVPTLIAWAIRIPVTTHNWKSIVKVPLSYSAVPLQHSASPLDFACIEMIEVMLISKMSIQTPTGPIAAIFGRPVICIRGYTAANHLMKPKIEQDKVGQPCIVDLEFLMQTSFSLRFKTAAEGHWYLHVAGTSQRSRLWKLGRQTLRQYPEKSCLISN